MIEFELPTYYGVFISFYEENSKYYMYYSEHHQGRTEITKEFYSAAIKEFSSEKAWKIS
jgi:hypothetical protein